MPADIHHAPVVHDKDHVGILDRCDPLGNDDLGCRRNVGCKTRPDHGVRPGIHSRGGVVQNEYFGLAEQRPRNAQPLLLPAGHVGAALLDMRVIPVREGSDKLIRLRQAARFLKLCIGRIRITPAQVFPDGSRKQQVLLQNHGYAVAQDVQIVVPHIHAAYRGLSLRSHHTDAE